MVVFDEKTVKWFLDTFLLFDPDGVVDLNELIDSTAIATGLAVTDELVEAYLYENKYLIEEGKVQGVEFLF